MLKATNSWAINIDRGQVVNDVCSCLDLKKALDTVYHRILLSKLKLVSFLLRHCTQTCFIKCLLKVSKMRCPPAWWNNSRVRPRILVALIAIEGLLISCEKSTLNKQAHSFIVKLFPSGITSSNKTKLYVNFHHIPLMRTVRSKTLLFFFKKCSNF